MEQIEQAISEKGEEQDQVLDECRRILSSSWWMPVSTRAEGLLTHFTDLAQKEHTRVERIGVLRYEIMNLKTAIAAYELSPLAASLGEEFSRSFVSIAAGEVAHAAEHSPDHDEVNDWERERNIEHS